MRRTFLQLVAVIVGVSLLGAGCGQATPSPTSTPAKAAPTAAPAQSAATKAPATQPAATPAAAAKKVDWPEKGKAVQIIVSITAGGSTDVQTRLLAAGLEKQFPGASFQVVNKPGGGQLLGYTEAAKAKPDGYVLACFSGPSANLLYLDKERGATYDLKSFQPVAQYLTSAQTLGVRTDSPYKTVKDLVDAAKANPGKIRVAAGDLLSSNHLIYMLLERAASIKFATVHFDGGQPGITALLGGHVEVASQQVGGISSQVKAGTVRVLAVADTKTYEQLPGVPTFESQGYNVLTPTDNFLVAPAGTPMEIVNMLSAAVERVVKTDEDIKKKLEALGVNLRYRNPEESLAEIQRLDKDLLPLIELSRQK